MNNLQTANWQFDAIAQLEPLEQNKIDPLAFRKQVIYAGNHVKGESDEFTIDEELIDHWVETGNEMIGAGIEIPLPKKHNEDDPELNRGYVNKFVKANDGQGRASLYVFGKFADAESAKLANRANVSLFSPPKKAIAGKVYTRPITHVALTNYPVIKGLEGFTSLTLSYDEPMGEYNDDCPQCRKRKEKDNETTNVFALGDWAAIDAAGYELAETAGKAYACKTANGVMVCHEAPDDAEPFFTYVG